MDDHGFMADTTARALRLLDLLQSAQQRTVGELAERLEVDERTVRRDVRRLIESGIPIETVRGRYGGYRLAAGQRVLPLMFSNEEAVAVFLGLARGRSAAGEADLSAQTAMAKIMRALPAADTRQIDLLLGLMRPASRRTVDPDPAVMLTLAEAVHLRRVVDLRYRNGAGTPSRRTILPYGLAAHSDNWYLVAADPDTRQERTFRVDRIRTARSMPQTFTPPADLDVEQRLLDLFSTADYRWRVIMRIRDTEEHLRTFLPRSVARIERIDEAIDGSPGEGPPWHRVEIRADSLDWLPPIIAVMEADVVIEQPEELRDLVREVATRMLRVVGVSAGAPGS